LNRETLDDYTLGNIGPWGWLKRRYGAKFGHGMWKMNEHDDQSLDMGAPYFQRKQCIGYMGMDQYLLIPFFSGMNIHLPAILMFTRGTRF